MDHEGFTNFKFEKDSRGVFTATLDVPDRPVNIFDDNVIEELHRLVELIEQDSTVRLVVFRSGKKSGFLAGADVRRIQSLQTPKEAEHISEVGQKLFDRIEHLHVPTIAVIHGPCLGGGLEFALSCTYRVANEMSSTRIGLPEVELGILPAWGGTQRLPRTVGLVPALRIILEGKKLPAKEAANIGLVDMSAAPDQFDVAVEKFVADVLAGHKPHHKSAGWLATLRDRTSIGQKLVLRAVKKTIGKKGKQYPAVGAALRAIEAGLHGPREKGFEAERKGIGELLFTPACRSLIGLFFAREQARSTATWVHDAEAAAQPLAIQRIGVVGAGVMGAGIAQLAVYSGFDVVLRDVKQEFVDAGMQKIRALFDDLVHKGSMSRAEADARLAAVTPTVDWEPLAACDVVIEAVTEREDVKREVFQELDRRLRPEALIVTNTSALSVQHLADVTQRPDRVGGLHFFNPVHRMQLVEVVRAPATNEATVASLVNLVRKLGKSPIVTADQPGFLVNRILFPYMDEGVRMVCEGLPADKIDREMKKFGMPMGPLELLDYAGLDVGAHVARTLSPLSGDPSPTAQLLQSMVEKGWLGKKSGHGFYQYAKGRKGKPSELDLSKVKLPRRGGLIRTSALGGMSLIQQRLVGLLVNESARALGEHIVEEAWMVDLGMVLGTGFAPFRGGPLHVADDWGIPSLVHRLDGLRAEFGDRFAPSATLRKMSGEGRRFFPAPAVNRPANSPAANERTRAGA